MKSLATRLFLFPMLCLLLSGGIEDRPVMAANVDEVIVELMPDGTLIITGTDNSDAVTVWEEDYELFHLVHVVVGDEPLPEIWEDVTKIMFDGRGAIDVFVNETSLPCEANGGTGNDVLFGGSGTDELYGDGDDDVLVGRGGEDHLYGGPGKDILIGGSAIEHSELDYIPNSDLSHDTLHGGLGGDTFWQTVKRKRIVYYLFGRKHTKWLSLPQDTLEDVRTGYPDRDVVREFRQEG